MRIRMFQMLCATVLATSWALPARGVEVRAVRLQHADTGTRLILDLSGSAVHRMSVMAHAERIVVDVAGARLRAGGVRTPTAGGAVRQLRLRRAAGQLRIVLDLAHPVRASSFLAAPNGRDGYRLVIDLASLASPATPATPSERRPSPAVAGGVAHPPGAPVPGALTHGTVPGAVAQGTVPRGDIAQGTVPQGAVARGSVPHGAVAQVAGASARVETPIRAPHAPAAARDLVIAVDAGHGGDDPGAIGKHGTREKDVTLAIARELARRIDAEPGMHAVLTRDGDYFVTLRDRMQRARARQADLFLSVHADSAPDRRVDGSSVYILSPRGASDEAARWLAERENAADLIGGVSLDDKDDVLASVLLDLSQSAALSASEAAAEQVLRSLDQVGEIRKRQVQQARFVVLKSPDIPSMLVETAFISNPEEEQRLRSASHQARLAGAILHGLRDYFHANPPAGTRIAEMTAGGAGSARAILHTAGGLR
jgi:N-acetylmuramoyl-L-alanine amidase